MLWTILKAWLVLCGGAASSFLLVKLFVQVIVHYNLPPVYVMSLVAIYIPLAAIVLYVVFAKLLFWACDCEI